MTELSKSKYLTLPPKYFEVTRAKGRTITHLASIDIGLYGDFSHCGHYSRNWEIVGRLRDIEVTCKSCLKIFREMGIYPNLFPKEPRIEVPERLSTGMRCLIKPTCVSWFDDEKGNNEVLLIERSSSGRFSFLRLGQKELKRKDPKTVVGGGAWIGEEDLIFVDNNLKANMNFIDWYQEHEDEFCPDCGAWFPEQGTEEEAGAEPACPNEKCPGNLEAQGLCPSCATEWESRGFLWADGPGECKNCGFSYTG